MAAPLASGGSGRFDCQVTAMQGQVARRRKDAPVVGVSRDLSDSVIGWFRENGRVFPWRETNDPFHILVAEVLLRQTQARRLVDPYLELVAKYPNPESLARANVEALREWFKPLGLVRRADSLVECARILVRDYWGQVPPDLKQLQSLPGIGKYSARAILCMAFNSPEPMVDEGCGRVLRRVLGYENRGPAYSDGVLLHAAQTLLPEDKAREFNLGLIDIGASHCHTRTPDCAGCPLLRHCVFGSAQTAIRQRADE